jgi:hypothetical protein
MARLMAATPDRDARRCNEDPMMDTLLDLIADLSRWSRGNLHSISLALLATLLVLFGPGINAWVQQRIGGLNFLLRTLLFVLICACGYGLAMVFLPPWVARGLDYFNNYTLAPVLLLVFFLVGVIAERN